jgi:hypothetical protein
MPLVVLHVGHIEKLIANNHTSRYSFKQAIAAFENVESCDSAEIGAKAEPDHPRSHEPILYRDQRATVKVETIDRREA